MEIIINKLKIYSYRLWQPENKIKLKQNLKKTQEKSEIKAPPTEEKLRPRPVICDNMLSQISGDFSTASTMVLLVPSCYAGFVACLPGHAEN